MLMTSMVPEASDALRQRSTDCQDTCCGRSNASGSARTLERCLRCKKLGKRCRASSGQWPSSWPCRAENRPKIRHRMRTFEAAIVTVAVEVLVLVTALGIK